MSEWKDAPLKYNERLNAMYFDSESEKEEAVYVVDIPENADSFSVSVKVGESNDLNIKGYQDSGRITVGYGDGTNQEMSVTSQIISDKKEFVVLSLGDSANPISTGEADKLYIKSEGRNFDGGKIDFYFCEPDVSFYEKTSETLINRNLVFDMTLTGEKININGGAFGLEMLPKMVTFLTVLIAVIRIALRRIFKRKQKTKENKNFVSDE